MFTIFTIKGDKFFIINSFVLTSFKIDYAGRCLVESKTNKRSIHNDKLVKLSTNDFFNLRRFPQS